MALVALAACAPQIKDAPIPASGLGPLTGKVFGNCQGALIVLLHGDISRGGAADYMHSQASTLSSLHPDATVLSMLRPGYYDSEGRQSPGSNNGRRDHYTAENNAAVADTIANFAAARGIDRVIAVGHSGGAATLGNVIGQRPGLVDGAVLISCPCEIGKWRASNNRSRWPTSQSPIDAVSGVDPATVIIAITGANDSNTRPFLAEDYVAAAKARGLNASVQIVSGAGHGFRALSAPMKTAVAALLN
ncbi:MAG: alpha/beta fold hydrolase, partial [Pseudomonadota bacterium]